jgi:uncharacterized membrane protein YoaK (UPF0700 family)
MTPSPKTPDPSSSAEPASSGLLVSTRRVMALSAVAGCVEVIGYLDCGSIYPGIMTGNTVQLGLTLATLQWTRFGLIAYAVGSFFVGGLLAAVLRRHLRRPPVELLLMAALLLIASLVRQDAGLRVLVELPLLAIAMALQGEAISKFGGVSIQTIVVTNNMVKFTDALVGRYLVRPRADAAGARPRLQEVLLPGLAWLTYSVAAGSAVMAAASWRFSLLVPVVILIAVSMDLLRNAPAPGPAGR